MEPIGFSFNKPTHCRLADRDDIYVANSRCGCTGAGL